jgi:hypothetical protein
MIIAYFRLWPGTSVRRNAGILLVLGVERKQLAHARNDADDPYLSSGG